LLILVITIALSIIILGIAFNQFNIESLNFSQNSQAANILISEDLIITHVFYNTSSNVLQVFVINTGSVNITIVRVDVINITKCSASNVCYASNSTPTTLAPNQFKLLNVAIGSKGLDLNAIYSIIVTSQVYVGSQPTGYFKQFTTSYSYSTKQIIQ
jgi:hypothetical protein